MWYRYGVTTSFGEFWYAWQQGEDIHVQSAKQGVGLALSQGDTLEMRVTDQRTLNIPANEVRAWWMEVREEAPSEMVIPVGQILDELLPSVEEIAEEYRIHWGYQRMHKSIEDAARDCHLLVTRAIFKRRGVSSPKDFTSSP